MSSDSPIENHVQGGRRPGKRTFALRQISLFGDIQENETRHERSSVNAFHHKEAKLKLWETAVDNVSDAIEITNADGIIQYVNPAFEKLTGFTAKEIIGRRPNVFKSDRHTDAFYENLWETIRSGNTWEGRFINRRKDGVLYEADASITPVSDPQGNVTHYVSVKQDVTKETKRDEQLRQIQKMEALATLAGGIAHDFNNILSSILGYTELSQQIVRKNSEIHYNLDRVLQAGMRARELIKQILSFSRQDRQEKRPIKIVPVIKEALQMLRSTLPKTIEIRQRIESDGIVVISPTHLHQVAMNLCTNAFHAMEEAGGVLEISLTEEILSLDDALQYPNLQPGPYVRLGVSDTGPGMDAETAKRIFDPYFSTKDKSRGTGLGLSVVQGIVHGCEGTIRVYTEPGNGTTFIILLPAAHKAGVITCEPTGAKFPVGKGERVLYVDDEQFIVDIGKKMLERLKYKVVARTSSVEALGAFKANPDAFDLVITDMTMPNMTGDQLATEVLKIRPDIPIILCTGFSERTSEERATAFGIKAFLLKPITMNTLATTANEVLKGA